MIRIAIVDDDSDMLQLIKECMADVIDYTFVETETFASAEAFLHELMIGKRYDILLADISLPEMDGMELGKIVREKWPDMYLVFLTSYREYAADSYNIDADQYILKCNMGDRLWKVMKRLIERRNMENGHYRVVGTAENDAQERRVIYCNEIIYISKVKGSKYVEYITTAGQYRERITLDNLKKELPEKEFIMVDRSYIVNIKHIIKMSSHVIYLNGDYHVTVSRSYLSKVKQQIHDYGRGK
ncbi:MAG: response regulator transcription factor [Dorea sp.]|nr:response regulator transcription factor [Dorea sp.]